MKEISVIGITGNMGSGKSVASHYIQSKGYKVLFSDDIAKEIITNDSAVKASIIKAFGEETYKDGKYNVAYISGKVFGESLENEENMLTLNGIIHPVVIQELMNQIEAAAENGEEHIFVESALIFELELEEGFNYIINIHSDEEIIVNRIVERNGISPEEARKRLKSQMSAEEKSKNADFTVLNNSTIEAMHKSLDTILSFIL